MGDARRRSSNDGPRARSRYLKAAADLATRLEPDGSGHPFVAAGVKLAEVSEALGYTRTAFYRRWDTKQDFWVDLSCYLVFDNDFGERSEETVPWHIVGAFAEGLADADQVEMIEAMRNGLNLGQQLAVADPGVHLRAALLGYGQTPDIADVRRAVEQRRLQDFGEILAWVLRVDHKRVTPPLESYGAAAALWCLADGFATLHRFVPAIGEAEVVVDDGLGPRPWSLFAYAARCLLVEAADDGGSRDGPGPRPQTSSLEPLLSQVASRWSPGQLEALEAASALYQERTAPQGTIDLQPDDEVHALPQVTMASVAHAAGVSRTAVYNLWATATDLRLDLLRGLLAAERAARASRIERLKAELGGADATAPDVLAALVRRPARDRLSAAHAQLAFLPDANHPRVREVWREGIEANLSLLATCVGELLPRSSRASGPELDDHDVATLLMATALGAERLMRTNPIALAAPLTGAGAAGSGPAVLARALVDHRSENIRDGRHHPRNASV